MGVDLDVFEPTKHIIGASVQTDGIWVWQKALPYYFSGYNSRLQPAFLEHIRNQNYQIPAVPANRGAELAKQLNKFL